LPYHVIAGAPLAQTLELPKAEPDTNGGDHDGKNGGEDVAASKPGG
jgi:hypothetical protein